MIIKTLQIEGFGSIQNPLVFNLDRKGINLVKGQNGHGKTTLFTALIWALYQINPKGGNVNSVATWEHDRLPTFEGTRVSVTIEIKGKYYTIVRHLNYKGKTFGYAGGSKLMVFISEQGAEPQLYEGQHKSDSQSLVNELLGMDGKTFLSSVLFGQRMKRLIEADNEEKRQLFDKLFELSFVEEAKTKAKDFYDLTLASKTKLDNEVALYNSQLSSAIAELTRGKEILLHFDEAKQARILPLQAEITDLNSEIGLLKSGISKLEKELKEMGSLDGLEELEKEADTKRQAFQLAKRKVIDSKEAVEQIEETIRKANRELNTTEVQIDSLRKALEGVETTCTVCGKALEPSEVEGAKAKILTKIDTLEASRTKQLEQMTNYPTTQSERELTLQASISNRTKAEEDVKAAEQAVEVYAPAKQKATQVGANIQSHNSKLEYAQKTLDRLSKQLETEKATTPPILDIEGLETKIEALRTSITTNEIEANKLSKHIEYSKWWLQNGFGANGLKSYVFNAMLDTLNNLILKYSTSLGVVVNFSIDMEKANKPFITTCIKDGRVIQYSDLSGGEKQRIDVATAFAMHDLISTKSNINLLIMDECMEGLDEQGIDLVFQMLQDKCEMGKTIFVITHNSTLDIINAKSIHVTKQQGNTVVN